MLMGYYMESGHMNINVPGCFFEKEIIFYTIVMILTLAVIIFSAWKAPKRIRPAGRIALSFTLLKVFTTVVSYIDLRMIAGDEWDCIFGMRVWYNCLSVAVLGLSVYLISVIVNIIKTPRI